MQHPSDIFPPALYCGVVNLLNRLRSKKHRISPTAEPGIYCVTDGDETLFICRRVRHKRSKRGVVDGVDRLARSYNLNHIPVAPGDLLIDCGANIGELGVWARSRGLAYIAFEPEALEARCVDLNAFAGRPEANRMALWNEDTVLKLFSKPGTADSSVIAMNDFDTVREIPAKRLDTALANLPETGKVILKVEAEGAEPEVLAGAQGILHRIDYVAIDCGFERGPEQADTFAETNTFLVDNGFRVEKARFDRITMLYRNRARETASAR